MKIQYFILCLLVVGCAGKAPVEEGILNGHGVLNTSMKPQNFYNMAETLYQKQDYLAALNLYKRGLENNPASPTTPQYKTGMAKCLLQLGDKEQALSLLEPLRDNGLLSNDGLIILAEAYMRTNQIDKADIILNALKDRIDDNGKLFTLLGAREDLLLKHERARQYYQQALNLDENPSANIINLALSYALTDDFATAQALITQVENSEDTRALIIALAGNLDEAERIITASFHRKGLNATDVVQNMRFYETLNQLSLKGRAKAVVLGIVEPDE